MLRLWYVAVYKYIETNYYFLLFHAKNNKKLGGVLMIKMDIDAIVLRLTDSTATVNGNTLTEDEKKCVGNKLNQQAADRIVLVPKMM